MPTGSEIEIRGKAIAQQCSAEELDRTEKSLFEICDHSTCGDCILKTENTCIYNIITEELSKRKRSRFTSGVEIAAEYSLDEILDALYIKVKGE